MRGPAANLILRKSLFAAHFLSTPSILSLPRTRAAGTTNTHQYTPMFFLHDRRPALKGRYISARGQATIGSATPGTSKRKIFLAPTGRHKRRGDAGFYGSVRMGTELKTREPKGWARSTGSSDLASCYFAAASRRGSRRKGENPGSFFGRALTFSIGRQ